MRFVKFNAAEVNCTSSTNPIEGGRSGREQRMEGRERAVKWEPEKNVAKSIFRTPFLLEKTLRRRMRL